MKIGIINDTYPSYSNLSEDIKQVLEDEGYVAVNNVSPFSQMSFNGLIVLANASDVLHRPYFVKYYLSKKPKILYTGADGVMIYDIQLNWLYQNIDPIANSEFSYRNLVKAGIKPRGALLHGVNIALAEQAEKKAEELRSTLRQQYGNAVLIGIVSGTSERKNMKLFVNTAHILNTQLTDVAKQIHFFVITHKDFLKTVVPANVHYIAEFGTKSREDIFAFYGAMDYTLVPSGTESFGFPVIESMAMGTPVIHMPVSAMKEFTSWQYNILFSPKTLETYLDSRTMVQTEIARFDPAELAVLLSNVVGLTDRPIRRENLKKLAKNYEIHKQYTYFVEQLSSDV